MGASLSWDNGYDIAIDNGSNVYVVGASEFTWGAPKNTYAGNTDAFVAKLNSNGVRLWNTFMGLAVRSNSGHAIVLKGNSNFYVAGHSYATWGIPNNTYRGECEAFVASYKLPPAPPVKFSLPPVLYLLLSD